MLVSLIESMSFLIFYVGGRGGRGGRGAKELDANHASKDAVN